MIFSCFGDNTFSNRLNRILTNLPKNATLFLNLTKMIDTIQITSRAQRWLHQARTIRLLHDFDTVCNLVNQEGNVLSVQSSDLPMGPFSLQISAGNFVQLDWYRPLIIDPQRNLWVGDQAISISQAEVWRPKPNWHLFDPAQTIQLDHKIDEELKQIFQKLIAGLQNNDAVRVVHAAERLAGRGSGLTPTGDDLLMGVMYGLWVLGQSEWLNMLESTAVDRTTTLSAAFLACASAGEATEPWHDLVAGRPRAVETILEIGHTSGADALFGFVNALKQLDTR